MQRCCNTPRPKGAKFVGELSIIFERILNEWNWVCIRSAPVRDTWLSSNNDPLSENLFSTLHFVLCYVPLFSELTYFGVNRVLHDELIIRVVELIVSGYTAIECF